MKIRECMNVSLIKEEKEEIMTKTIERMFEDTEFKLGAVNGKKMETDSY